MKKYTKILIVGAGPMAIEYAKVLKAQKSEFITVGNTKKGANNFKKDIKTHVVLGGIENWLKNNPSIDFSSYKVIVVVNEHLQVFSKKELNRFPNSSYEVIKTIRDAVDERRLG